MLPCAVAVIAYAQPVTRRDLLAAAVAVPNFPGPARAASSRGSDVDAILCVSELSMRARTLQNEVREHAAATRGRVVSERPQLKAMLDAMDSAAPDLHLCLPTLADCNCQPDASLMHDARLQVETVRAQLANLDVALASGARGFDPISDDGMLASYPGGAVERSLEEICEAADRFLDLASGRPLMTARLGLLSSNGIELEQVSPLGSLRSWRPARSSTIRAQLPPAEFESDVLWLISLGAAAYLSGYATEGFEAHKL